MAADLTAGDAHLGEWPEAIDYLVYCAAAGSRDESVYRAVYLQGLRHVLTKVYFDEDIAKAHFLYLQYGGLSPECGGMGR